VALTLTPMLCSRFLTLRGHAGWLSGRLRPTLTRRSRRYGRVAIRAATQWRRLKIRAVSLARGGLTCLRWIDDALFARFTPWLQGMESRYREAIVWTLRNRWRTVLIAVGIVCLTPLLMAGLGFEFVPAEDEGSFQVTIKTPTGSSLEYSDGRMKAVEDRILARKDEVVSVFATLGVGRIGAVNQGVMYVNLTPRAKRDKSQQEIMAELAVEFTEIPGVQAFPASFSIAGNQRGEALQFAVQGPDLEGVARLAYELRERLGAQPALGAIDLDLNLDLPQIRLDVNRELAAEFGLGTRDIAQAANVIAGGLNVAKYSDEPGDGERYDIRLKAAGEVMVEDLSKIYLRSPNRSLIRLDTVAKFEQTVGPSIIPRLNRQYAAYFYSDPTVSLGQAVSTVKKEAAEVLLPGYRLRMLGRSEELGNTQSTLGFAFVMALALIYMVLASQFNSFGQPLIIMVAQPLAIVGGVAALLLTRDTLNLYSMTGLVLLIGLVAKNSILLVDITNQLRTQGMSVDEALLEACPRRLRPILMTSLTIICAMLAPALGFSTGAELSGPLASAVIGGLVSSTLLTLVVVPAVYSLVESSRRSANETTSATTEQRTETGQG